MACQAPSPVRMPRQTQKLCLHVLVSAIRATNPAADAPDAGMPQHLLLGYMLEFHGQQVPPLPKSKLKCCCICMHAYERAANLRHNKQQQQRRPQNITIYHSTSQNHVSIAQPGAYTYLSRCPRLLCQGARRPASSANFLTRHMPEGRRRRDSS